MLCWFCRTGTRRKQSSLRLDRGGLAGRLWGQENIIVTAGKAQILHLHVSLFRLLLYLEWLLTLLKFDLQIELQKDNIWRDVTFQAMQTFEVQPQSELMHALNERQCLRDSERSCRVWSSFMSAKDTSAVCHLSPHNL